MLHRVTGFSKEGFWGQPQTNYLKIIKLFDQSQAVNHFMWFVRLWMKSLRVTIKIKKVIKPQQEGQPQTSPAIKT